MHRTTEFAYRKRDAIFEVLGSKCAACGSKKNLEFDLIVPTPLPKSHHHNLSFAHRMIFYCRQLSAGNLQVLCSKCNSRKMRSHTRYIVPAVRVVSHKTEFVKVNPF